MKKMKLKWLVIGTVTYIGGTILASSVLTIGVMLLFPEIPPSELNTTAPTNTLFRIAEAIIGFTVALSVARWVCMKTHQNHSHTLWAFAAVLTVYGFISIYLHDPNLLSLTAFGKICAPWIVALLAQKWVMSTHR